MSSQADFNASMRYYLSNGIHSIQFTCIIFVNIRSNCVMYSIKCSQLSFVF